jgi:hypothetical protein
MLGTAWLTLRQAREALRNGRLEEARQLLGQPAASGHRKRPALLAQLARAFAGRGERLLRQDDTDGAWRDLVAAEGLQTAERGVEQLRQALTRLAVAEVRALLQAGELNRAEVAVARARGRGVRSPELDVLDEAVRNWLLGRDLADRGEFNPALEIADRVRRLLPGPVQALEKFRAELGLRQQSCAALLVRLHEASAAARWPEVVDLVEQVLALAPNHAEARKLRARAWQAIEPVTTPGRTLAALPPNQAVGEGGPAPRYLLWIDGVGGYLICLGPRVMLGQAVLTARVDVPLVADVARLHASLTRDVEGYLLEAVRGVQVNGQPVTRALLRHEDRVTLGTSCQLLFRQPVPLSLSARLDLVSGHRLPLAVDAVLLMADTLVLAGSPQAHITVPELRSPLVLFRNKDQLGIRSEGTLIIDGQKATGRCLLEANAHVTSDEITFSLEPATPRLG